MQKYCCIKTINYFLPRLSCEGQVFGIALSNIHISFKDTTIERIMKILGTHEALQVLVEPLLSTAKDKNTLNSDYNINRSNLVRNKINFSTIVKYVKEKKNQSNKSSRFPFFRI